LGSNSITVAAVSFDRAVKFQFSSGDVEFDDLTLNGVVSSCIGTPPVDCNGIIAGTALIDDCGVCHQAYLYDFILHTVIFLDDTTGVIPSPTQIIVMPDDSSNPYWNSSCVDCAGVVNGLSIVDDCGICQSSLIYDYVTHVASPISDTSGYVFGPTEMLVLANSPMNPAWNSSCTDCNGIVNGTSLLDDCGVCQQAYIYNTITHAVNFIDDTTNLSLDGGEIVVLPNNSMSPYWNSSCSFTDCNGVLNGTALTDSCGICHQAYIYDVITHSVTFINDTINLNLLPTQILVLPNDPSNPYWNAQCRDCNGIVNGLAMVDDCGVCQSALIYNYITHVAIPVTDTNGIILDPTEMLVLPNSSMNPSWNSSCIIDCNGIVNGLAMVDDCGVCQPALVYNYVTHVALPIIDTSGYVFGPTEMLVLPNSPMNPIWNSSCVLGCTDVNATNYDPNATTDDGSCTYASACGNITGIFVDNIIHDRVVFNWDDMNSSTCQVDQVRIRYREVGTNSYSNKTMGAPVGSGCNTTNTSKLALNLTPSTQYEYDFKIWYCDGTVMNWHNNGTFTTAPECDNVINVTATPVNTTKTTFCWDTVSTYSFVRLQYRENVPGSSFSNIGGFGVFSPLTCKDKNGLTPGTQYRVMWRTWCSATGGPYRSPVWDGPVIWDQPTSIRLEGGTSINNLDVYPNPSRDIFNVTFTSEDVQNLEVRIINVIGEVVYSENLMQFVGEYTKQVDLATYTKGVYFLEITTDNGVINKKLILQ
ncbi:MAG: hypothetical protein CMD02_04600, partial [Flavobacteriales bacterium]|nr:hypothetical protein [Flavobacteriales bacterium]